MDTPCSSLDRSKTASQCHTALDPAWRRFVSAADIVVRRNMDMEVFEAPWISAILDFMITTVMLWSNVVLRVFRRLITFRLSGHLSKLHVTEF